MIILGIGSNLSSKFGNRFKNINLAISYLKKDKINIIKKSNFFETPSYPNNKNPKFINVVIAIKANITKVKLASTIIKIERKLQRKRIQKNDPRTCDIDIIDFNGISTDFKYKNLNFTVPHKNLIYRNFVLYPLREILPLWKHPVSRIPVNALIGKLSSNDKKSILKVKKY